MTLEKLYTVEEIAEMTSVTTRTVRNYLRLGILKGRKIGGQWRFSQDDVAEMLNRKEVASEQADKSREIQAQFASGKYAEDFGGASACLIVDVPCSKNDAAKLGKTVCELWNREPDSRGVFRYDYLDDRAAARFTVVATPSFTAEILGVLNGGEGD